MLAFMLSGCGCVSLGEIADARSAADAATDASFRDALRAGGLSAIEPPVRRLAEADHDATEMRTDEISFPIAEGSPSPTFAANEDGEVFRVRRRPTRQPRDHHDICGCAPAIPESPPVTVEIYLIQDYGGDVTLRYTDHGLDFEYEHRSTACPARLAEAE